jgi:GH25 family lysozyme M1 (1,4-beta-N-acetylmuramidase)
MTILGTDWAKYQGNTGVWGTAVDAFAICQVGGYNGRFYRQYTYASQIRSVQSRGRCAHTYIWLQVGGSVSLARQTVAYCLPYVTAPKGSIIAVDYEAGASNSVSANTNAVIAAMRAIKMAGYTPVYYSYKPYTLAHINSAAIVREFGTCLWIAAYPFVHAVPKPDMRHFPSMDGIAIWQFTDKYGREAGTDGDIDLTGITASKKAAKTAAKKEDDYMPQAKPRNLDFVGVAYTDGAVPIYTDATLKHKTGKQLGKRTAWRVISVKDGAVQLGTNSWASGADVLVRLNPLLDGKPGAVVEVAKDVYKQAKPLPKQPASSNTPLTKGTKWKTFGAYGDLSKPDNAFIDVGGAWVQADHVKVML